ncbi:unnamed protein product [Heligmosomoides polygyrus]|uniref:Reverse transcriptase domain-containing protein n=1 Tax=Heligmosomoides polygyrus TaxID=6339 RepID=A0A183F7U4_HELPZ|nr:unnamed protein product [Heligmosomoides polygyrus]
MEQTTLTQAQDIWPFRDTTYDNLNQVIKVQKTLNDHIDEGNTEIAQRLNGTFQTMRQCTPVVAVQSDQAPSLVIAPFSGLGDQGMHFSFWLRQLEDLQNIRTVPPTDDQKAYFLVAHLSGTAREKVEEPPREKRLKYMVGTYGIFAHFLRRAPAKVLSPSETGRMQAELIVSRFWQDYL